MRVGVLTGGGDCPGLNAVIRAVTKSLIGQGGCEVVGIADGFEGLMGDAPRVKPLGWEQVSGIVHTGGTILGTSNSANPLKDAATVAQVKANVQALGLEVVVSIGGDGTQSLANALAQAVGMQCVGVPKTIDNDIANCERSFGFDTAVATATDAMRRIESTAYSHHRVMIVETMGRNAGWHWRPALPGRPMSSCCRRSTSTCRRSLMFAVHASSASVTPSSALVKVPKSAIMR